MRNHVVVSRTLTSCLLGGVLAGLPAAWAFAQAPAAAAARQSVTELETALRAAKEGPSEARRRLAVKRVIRDVESLLESLADSPDRFVVLELLFRARQQLITLDDDSEHRKALLETCRELVKAPDDLAGLRLEADLLLSQADIARQGASSETRAKALRPFVERYVDTPAGARVVRMAMLMALELGDNNLVNDLQDMIAERFAGDLDMISFQRDKLGGQVIGAPFVGTFQRSDGETVRFPMDTLGRSALLCFWSEKDGGKEVLAGLAKAALENKDLLAGRLDIISFNLDDLPDAGESIVRGHGVDWPVVRLPGGREHPVYKAYVRQDPRLVTLSPTGYTALLMAGSTRQKQTSDGEPDYGRMFGSSLARSWTDPRYIAQLSSLMAGDFLVLDPAGGIDPARPPEWKAVATGDTEPLPRSETSVPEDTLRAIQDCFIPPPRRYRLPPSESLANYAKAVELCRQAIDAHPTAPDLWIVRNRLLIALLGLWKTGGDLARLDDAVAEAKAAIAAGSPPGCDVAARLCIARGELRNPEAVPRELLDRFVEQNGGDKAAGPVLAAAALLALDVADRAAFENYRRIILERHAESPLMWIFSSFLLDRHHEYWLFQVPFTAGWSFGRREGYSMSRGEREEGCRALKAELRTLDDKPLRIPEDLDSPWTAIVFARKGPWSKKGGDGLPPSPESLTKPFTYFIATRPQGEVKLFLAMLDGDAEALHKGFEGREPLCPVLTVPNGIDNLLVQQLGILSEDNQLNSVLIDKHGRVAVMVSGLAGGGRGGAVAMANVIASEDEKAVAALLEGGDLQAAEDRIMLLAPPFDPEAVDARGRKPRKPEFNLAHLRARARVFLALGELDKALADAEEVVARQLGTDGGMSLRTDELDASEALRDEIREHIKAKTTTVD